MGPGGDIIQSMDRGRLRWLVVGAVALGGGVAGTSGLSAARPAQPRSCPRPSVAVPPNEPVYRSGPTEVVTGLYIQGGPVPPPPCRPQPRGPYAGRVTVANARTGAVVARRTVASGHLAHIKLAPGRYRLSGRISGGAPTTTSPTIRIRRGSRTRQDLFEDVP